jgi:8-oxo-dGTP diphosphatase
VARGLAPRGAQAAARVGALNEAWRARWRWWAPWRVVEAAGGVVWREGADSRAEVLVVHRPKYDDWTFPKGKLDSGENHAAAAAREVWEETGLRCRLGAPLAATSYRDRHGRRKRVRYWAMQAESGEFVPNHEVDEVRWVDVSAAAALLTYDRDRDVLASLRVRR